MKKAAVLLALFSLFASLYAGEPPAPTGAAKPPPLTLETADTRLAIAERMVQGGIYDRAMDLAASVLNDPAAQAVSGAPAEITEWLKRRETGRFLLDQARFGLAKTRDEYLDVAASLEQLVNNRYRLQEPAYNVQAAYWAARAYEAAGEYQQAIDLYGKVGGITLPAGMEGDAAQRTSRCLRLLAEEIPYPGGVKDRQRRDRLLDQAIGELDRARLAFPVGDKRKEIELDRIALRMARREEQFVREASTEAEAFIESDPAKDELRARAAVYRGNAAALLGQPADAAKWYRRVINDEAPSDEDRREAGLGLALALVEMSESLGREDARRLLSQADAALDAALAGMASPGRWDGARVVKARVQLNLGLPSAALDTLAPILAAGRVDYGAWQVAGRAELARGRLGEALDYLYPATRPSNPNQILRYNASREASRTADARRDFGLAIALNHQASRMLRRSRLFSSLLVSEFQAMETILRLGKMEGPVSLSGDMDLLMSDSESAVILVDHKRAGSAEDLARDLGRLLAGGGNPDSGYDLAISAEAADEWLGNGIDKLELAIGMISHLRKRQPAGVTDSVLSSRLGEARHALGLAKAEKILRDDEPSEEEIDRTLGDFAAAAASFQESAADGLSLQDSLNQGMVNMESGAFLMRLADKWNVGAWSSRSMLWRDEARRRIEASLRPFNQAIATSGPSSLAARRARWSRGRALELMGEWRGAAADYLSLMNNSELPRVLRANAARRWAVCMAEMGEQRQALTRLAVFADIDAEAALLAGKLAEDSGYPRDAYQRYLFAANPASPSLPPVSPWRVQEAAYRAARLALADPNEADPLRPARQVADAARGILERNALDNLDGAWAIPMLNLLGDSWIAEKPDGWRVAERLAGEIRAAAGSVRAVERAMYILAARAFSSGGEYERALDALDEARDLAGDSAAARQDAATIMLETARIYRMQGRDADALRAFADVFAVYPEAADTAEAARLEAAEMLLKSPAAGQREREQARNILSGLRDQVLADRIMREYGIR